MGGKLNNIWRYMKVENNAITFQESIFCAWKHLDQHHIKQNITLIQKRGKSNDWSYTK